MEEIERRFLCTSTPSPELLAQADKVQEIRQGYLTRVGPAIRVRQKDEAYLMTVKSGQGLIRKEVEWPIPAGVASELFEIAGDRTIAKTRYVLGRWEIDVFAGTLTGLVVVEVELESAAEATPAPPAGLPPLVEVTDEPALTNRWLAGLDPASAVAFVEALSRGVDTGMRWARENAFEEEDASLA